MASPSPNDITHVIQLAIAPVFLLSSVGTFLGVLSMRLGRIVDRARALQERRSDAEDERQRRLAVELGSLLRRRRLVSWAIAAGTFAALFVCSLIATAFVGSLLDVNTGPALATLFILAMVAFVSALGLFLREVLIASASVPLEAH